MARPCWDYSRARRVLLPDTAAMLAAERHKRGWSLRQAGRAIGCSYETVRLLELRRRVPSVALALEIAGAYELGAKESVRLFREAADNAGYSKRRAA
jgi:transcriptional regulator with XRE-family HTH domain